MTIANEQVAQAFLTEYVIVVDIYCRSAAEDGNTLAAQEATCRQFAKDAGFTVGMVYAEIASGMRLERESLALLRTHYTAGGIQGVVIVTLDRLSRNAADLLTVQAEMMEHHVTLHCVEEAVGQFYPAIIARTMSNALASQERD
jgi:DNA invertase Pin-like site-specific DNA recombinase